MGVDCIVENVFVTHQFVLIFSIMRGCNSYDELLHLLQKPQESEENMSVAARLEAAKRRLHERYEKVESGEFCSGHV